MFGPGSLSSLRNKILKKEDKGYAAEVIFPIAQSQ
jgi:hypothetical protein